MAPCELSSSFIFWKNSSKFSLLGTHPPPGMRSRVSGYIFKTLTKWSSTGKSPRLAWGALHQYSWDKFWMMRNLNFSCSLSLLPTRHLSECSGSSCAPGSQPRPTPQKAPSARAPSSCPQSDLKVNPGGDHHAKGWKCLWHWIKISLRMGKKDNKTVLQEGVQRQRSYWDEVETGTQSLDSSFTYRMITLPSGGASGQWLQ